MNEEIADGPASRVAIGLLSVVLAIATVGNIVDLCGLELWSCATSTVVPYVFIPTIFLLVCILWGMGKTPLLIVKYAYHLSMITYLTIFAGYFLLLDPIAYPGYTAVAYIFQGILLVSGVAVLPSYSFKSILFNTLLISGLALIGFSKYLLLENPTITIISTIVESLAGVFVAYYILKARRMSFYLNSVSQVIFDGVTNKAPIEIAEYLPEKMVHRENKLNLTIMFVDIVGYSLLNSKLDESRLKEMISETYSRINKIASKHGGKIDKSLGDGLLLYFDSPDEALNAAVQIQMTSLLRGIRSKKVLPLRIGLNTAEVLSADMGDKKRIDVTLMGEGVILAQRLESACNPYKIMVGEGTRENLSEDWKEKDLGCECLIQIKHSPEPLKAWQYNPFDHDAELLKQADEIFWGSLGKEIKKGRFKIRGDAGIVLRSDLGEFVLRDFSENGFGVTGPVLLGRGYSLEVGISGNEKVDKILSEKLMHEISVSVVWSRRSDSGVLKMGMKIVGRNKKERELISSVLSDFVESEAA